MSSQIDEIKSRLDIAELVGSYIRLQKAGANFKALCPFHNERTPSFNVSPARQIWHCFGCGKGGDMFEFIQQIEGVEFGEALKTLADRAGVELKREDPRLKSERTRQFALLEEATKFFEEKLWQGGVEPLEYLKKRGLQDETIKTFRLGYASDEWRALGAHLKQKARLPDGQGFSEKDLENSGLAVKSGQGYYDRFRGRIIFPIFDYSGRVVAFGGRVFPEREQEAKYVNSPETALYQKSKILYGLNFAKSEILRASECVLVEGYMDVIMSWQGGVKNVVAASGTALTADQLK
ncbi:MAG: DNA primase, partial [bacterium]|nr:DNA primase [bacterium]